MVTTLSQPGVVRARNFHNYALWLALGLSIVSVVLLRWFSGEGVTAFDFVAVGIAAIAVGGYAAYAWWASKHAALPIGRDQAGDNAYYIGLLLTFTSLGVALVKLVVLIGPEGSNSEIPAAAVEQIAQLIPDFGVALSSTIFGITARLWLQQQRMSPAEASELARGELERAVAEFTRNLRVATGTISTSTNTVRLGVAKQLEQAAYGQIESFEEAQESVRDAAMKMTRGLTNLAQMLADANATVAAELVALEDAKPSAALRDLSDQARDAGAAVKELRKECVTASRQTEELCVQLDALDKRLAAVAPGDNADRLNALIQDALTGTESIVGAIARSDPQVSEAEALLKKTVQSAGTMEAVAGRAAKTASELDVELKSAQDAAHGLESGLKGAAYRAWVFEREMESVAEKATSALQKTATVAQTLDTQVTTVVQELRALQNDIHTLQKEVKDVRPEVIKVADGISDLLPDEKAEALRAAVTEAHQRLVDLAKRTDGDAVADEMVRILDERLQDFARKLKNPEALEPAVAEGVSTPPLDADEHPSTRDKTDWRKRWGFLRR